MTKQTMGQRFGDWLKELWGEDEVMMQRIPDEDFRLREDR